MFTGLLILQVLLGMVIIGMILLQQGKGADMGAAFGAGASGSVFGARGGGSFFSRTTAVLAALFFANSLLLSSPLVLKPRNPQATVTATPEKPAVEVPPTDAADGGKNLDLPPADLQGTDTGKLETPATADMPPADEAMHPDSKKVETPATGDSSAGSGVPKSDAKVKTPSAAKTPKTGKAAGSVKKTGTSSSVAVPDSAGNKPTGDATE